MLVEDYHVGAKRSFRLISSAGSDDRRPMSDLALFGFCTSVTARCSESNTAGR